jgi:hypothetical protein
MPSDIQMPAASVSRGQSASPAKQVTLILSGAKPSRCVRNWKLSVIASCLN